MYDVGVCCRGENLHILCWPWKYNKAQPKFHFTTWTHKTESHIHLSGKIHQPSLCLMKLGHHPQKYLLIVITREKKLGGCLCESQKLRLKRLTHSACHRLCPMAQPCLHLWWMITCIFSSSLKHSAQASVSVFQHFAYYRKTTLDQSFTREDCREISATIWGKLDNECTVVVTLWNITTGKCTETP
jgi:hypothetical protein